MAKIGEYDSPEDDNRALRDLAYTYLSPGRCICGTLKNRGYCCSTCGDDMGLGWGERENYTYSKSKKQWVRKKPQQTERRKRKTDRRTGTDRRKKT